MKQLTAARILIILASVTLFVITYLGYRKIDDLVTVSNLINETYASHVQLEKAYSLLRTADSELSSFLLTGDTTAYQAFVQAEADLGKTISTLYARMRDQPEQCHRLYKMEQLIKDRFVLLEKNRRVKTPDERRKVIAEINVLNEKVYASINTMVAKQSAMLNARQAIKTERESLVPLIFFGIAIFCVLLFVLSYLKVTSELSLRIAAQRELELKHRQLQHTNRELEHFAFGSGHDLQEPLRKIETFCSMIERKNLTGNSPEATHLFSKIQASAKHMRKLVNDLLGYAHFYYATEGREAVDLNEVVGSVLRDFQSLIEQKKAKIRCSRLPVVHGVRAQFHRLFHNLVSNALTYSRNTPVIDISAVTLDEQETRDALKIPTVHGAFHRIAVEDNGIGFEPEFNDRIFQMFQRLHDKQTYEGSGIGLAICKKIVQNHDGFIAAEGVKGSGSVFYIYLPYETFTDVVQGSIRQTEGVTREPAA